MSRIIYRELTHAERDEWASGYEAGLASLEGDQPPAPDSDPYGAGWRDGNIEARELASAAADRADAEIDAALGPPERVAVCPSCRWTCRHAWMPDGQWQCGCCGHVRTLEIGAAPVTPERVPMHDGHAAWALQRVEQGWGS